MGRHRNPPRWVKQTGVKCWAASLEAWLDATPGRPKLTQDYLVRRFSDHPDGSLNPMKFGPISETAGMGWNIMTLQSPRPGNPQVTPDLIQSLLNERGLLYVAYQVSSTWWHAIVVYGINSQASGWTMLNVMDPEPNVGFTQRPLPELFSVADFILVGWPGY